MNIREQLSLSDEHYNFLFDIRRSARYHERRKAFFELVQNIFSFLTIVMAGVVLMDVIKQGDTPRWVLWIGVGAALLSALDLVIGFSKKASIHSALREKFADLEIDIISGKQDGEIWNEYQKKRLLIEKDEPAIYYAIDGMCRNELLIADGFSRKNDKEHFASINFFQKFTAQFFRWESSNFF